MEDLPEKIKELQEFIQRFSANASKSKQATSRKRALEKIQLDEIRPSSRKYPYIDFRPNREIGNEVLMVENLSKTIDGVKVLDNISFTLGREDKVAFVGKNGEGKSTLVKCIMKEIEHEGTLTIGHNVQIGYFAQNQASLLDENLTVFQTIDDPLNHIAQHGTAETLACTIFGVVPQAAYAVFQLDNGAFSARLMNSYLKLDCPAMRRWLGGDHAAFAAEYYVLGNKINAFGDLYVYFYYAKDAAGNTFTVDVHADKNGEKISEIDVYVSADRNDADKQLAIWKEYARDYADKGLGAFKEAYTTDSWGDRKETFADLAAAVAHVESNGRPGPFDGGIIVVFEADGVATNLVMNPVSYTHLTLPTT